MPTGVYLRKLGRKASKKQIEANRKSHIGLKQSKETIEKRVSHFRGDKHFNWKGGKPKCPICGKQLKKYKSKTCKEHYKSMGCWRGGITYDRKKYREIVKNRKPGIFSFYAERRRTLKMNAEGSHTLGEWQTLLAQYNYTCLSCGKMEPDIVLTEDHIIPLSKGGSNNIENIQPLCKSCNSKKHTKIVDYKETYGK